MKTYLVIVLSLLLLAPSSFAQIKRAKDAPRPLTPEESLRRFRLPKDVDVELVASEPLIADPAAIAFDEHGRLFVCELHGYNLDGHMEIVELNKTGKLDRKIRRIRTVSPAAKAAADKQTYGTVKLLTDTDGDGRMDKATVWADRLPPCYGLIATSGGVIVICAPDIVFLADRDGDGKAEARKTLFSGFKVRVLERAINNPRWGPDNWIYVAAGGGGGTIRGPRLKKPIEIGHTDFRFKPDGSAIEPVTGTTSTFGQTQNEFGERFLVASGPGSYAIPLPYRYLARNPYVPSPNPIGQAATYSRVYPTSQPHPWRVSRSKNPAWVKFYGQRETTASGYFTSQCGPLIYLAQSMPKRFSGNYFVCDPSQNLVHRARISQAGHGYRIHRFKGEEASEFLTSTDQWFRPMNLIVGPAGSIYIVDMYREIIEDFSAIPRFLQQQYGLVMGRDRGRIWRLRAKNTRRGKTTWPSQLSSKSLVPQLANRNLWWRQTAQRLLIERADMSTVAAIENVATSFSFAPARMHALYTLAGMNSLRAAVVLKALQDDDYHIRVHALRLAESRLNRDKAIQAVVANMVTDKSDRVRIQLALTLGQWRSGRAIDLLAKLAIDHPGQTWLHGAILSSSRATATRLMRQLTKSPTATPALQGLLRLLASSVGSERHDASVGDLLTLIANRSKSPNKGRQRLQQDLLDGLYAGLRRGKPTTLKSAAGQRAIAALLSHSAASVRQRTLQISGLMKIDQSKVMQTIWSQALVIALSSKQTDKERLTAIGMLNTAPWPLREKLHSLIRPSRTLEFQLTVVNALATSDSKKVSAALLGNYDGLSPQVQTAIVDAHFARRNRLPQLVAAMESKIVDPNSLSSLRRAQLMESDDKTVSLRARKLFAGRIRNDRAKVLQKYQIALRLKPDPKHGEKVYREQCSKCHRIKKFGHAVGPDLTGVKSRANATILMDLIDPSRKITPGYRVFVVTTTAGRVRTGVLAEETATSITLKKEKGETETILRKNIARIQASSTSLMPDGLEKKVTPQDAADLLSYLREWLGPVVPPGIVLFDDNVGFVKALREGAAKATLISTNVFAGKRALQLNGFQRHSRQLPDWHFKIVRRPRVTVGNKPSGEYRYLRLAWRSKGKGVMIELAAGGHWPPPNKPTRRYFSGQNTTKWKAIEVSPISPKGWTVVTLDLWKDNGDFELTGIAPTSLGGTAFFDRIELLRSLGK